MKLISAHTNKPNHSGCMYINPDHIIYMHECFDDEDDIHPAKITIKLSDGSIIEKIISWSEVDFTQRGENVI